MADRLSELKRQRALLEEHLAWLNREIAAASRHESGGTRPPVVSDPSKPLPSPIISVSATDAPLPGTETETILRQYATAPQDAATSARRGCWMAFGAAFLFVFAIIATWYVVTRVMPVE